MDNFKQDNIRRIEAEKKAWSNKFVADATNNNLDHVGTLKYMNLLLDIDIHLQSVKYIINEQSLNISVFLLFFSFVFLQIERERGYTKFGIKRNSPKGTYLISLMEFCGESFFFYGLIEFMLFLILAWRKWLLHVRDILLSSTRSTGFGSVPYEPCPSTNFPYFLFPLTGGSPHFRFRVPANRLASTFPCQAKPSEVTKYKHLVSPVTHILS